MPTMWALWEEGASEREWLRSRVEGEGDVENAEETLVAAARVK